VRDVGAVTGGDWDRPENTGPVRETATYESLRQHVEWQRVRDAVAETPAAEQAPELATHAGYLDAVDVVDQPPLPASSYRRESM
jgi:hypothetical protein